jgi:hypothetical protein
MTKNRHKVDELADIRAEIRRLEQREAALRRQVIESGQWSAISTRPSCGAQSSNGSISRSARPN